jgi:hypothetical protein
VKRPIEWQAPVRVRRLSFASLNPRVACHTARSHSSMRLGGPATPSRATKPAAAARGAGPYSRSLGPPAPATERVSPTAAGAVPAAQPAGRMMQGRLSKDADGGRGSSLVAKATTVRRRRRRPGRRGWRPPTPRLPPTGARQTHAPPLPAIAGVGARVPSAARQAAEARPAAPAPTPRPAPAPGRPRPPRGNLHLCLCPAPPRLLRRRSP